LKILKIINKTLVYKLIPQMSAPIIIKNAPTVHRIITFPRYGIGMAALTCGTIPPAPKNIPIAIKIIPVSHPVN